MAKDFEEKVLDSLAKLTKGQDLLRNDVGSLQKGQKSLQKGQVSLEKGQKILEQKVDRFEVLHEETISKIETVIEIGKAQKELWQKAATKEDIHDLELHQGLARSVAKGHSIDIADHARRIKRVETKLKTA